MRWHAQVTFQGKQRDLWWQDGRLWGYEPLVAALFDELIESDGTGIGPAGFPPTSYTDHVQNPESTLAMLAQVVDHNSPINMTVEQGTWPTSPSETYPKGAIVG